VFLPPPAFVLVEGGGGGGKGERGRRREERGPAGAAGPRRTKKRGRAAACDSRAPTSTVPGFSPRACAKSLCTRAWKTPHGSRATISAAGSEAGAPLLLAAGGGGGLAPQRGFKKSNAAQCSLAL
jgi:hypothetical protein